MRATETAHRTIGRPNNTCRTALMTNFSHPSVASSLLGANILLDIYEVASVPTQKCVCTSIDRLRSVSSASRYMRRNRWTSHSSAFSYRRARRNFLIQLLYTYNVLIKQNHGSRLKREYKTDTCIQIQNDKEDENTKTGSWGMKSLQE